jgi:hypothetical protein
MTQHLVQQAVALRQRYSLTEEQKHCLTVWPALISGSAAAPD